MLPQHARFARGRFEGGAHVPGLGHAFERVIAELAGPSPFRTVLAAGGQGPAFQFLESGFDRVHADRHPAIADGPDGHRRGLEPHHHATSSPAAPPVASGPFDYDFDVIDADVLDDPDDDFF